MLPSQPWLRGSAHRALLRGVGSPELWWLMSVRGSGPSLAWGGDGKGSWKELGVQGRWVAEVSIGHLATLGLACTGQNL